MAYDEELGSRIRMALMVLDRSFEERRMFGGLCFMVKGHMVAGVADDELMLRCGEERAIAALTDPAARLFDFTGRPMKSILSIRPEGLESDEALMRWLSLALDFIDTDPPKKKPSKKRRAGLTKHR